MDGLPLDSGSTDPLQNAADRLIELLKDRQRKIVLAESCTAGLIAATLVQTVGISDYLCGSAVVYRNATKTAWLGVSAEDLADPQITAVSAPVAEAMAVGALTRTPEADIAASVSGYLGPEPDDEKDGLVYVGLANRSEAGTAEVWKVERIQLNEVPERIARQRDAVRQVLLLVGDMLERM